MGNTATRNTICPFCKELMVPKKNDGNGKYVLLCDNKNCSFIVRTKKHYKSIYDTKSEYYNSKVEIK